jgi:hypothetical protein
MSDYTGETESDLRLSMTVSVVEEPYDPLGPLKGFIAQFYGDEEHDKEVGSLYGWIGWSVLDDDIAGAADAISADSAYIGSVAAALLEGDESDQFIEDVVLVDRMWGRAPVSRAKTSWPDGRPVRHGSPSPRKRLLCCHRT